MEKGGRGGVGAAQPRVGTAKERLGGGHQAANGDSALGAPGLSLGSSWPSLSERQPVYPVGGQGLGLWPSV